MRLAHGLVTAFWLLGCAATTTSTESRPAGVTGPSDPEAAAAFSPGMRVVCRWRGGGTEYAGVVDSVRDGHLKIQYDDGDQEEITPRLCREGSTPRIAQPSLLETGPADERAAAEFQAGDRVACRYRGGPHDYTGSVAAVESGRLRIQYDDGDQERIAPDLCVHFTGHSAGCRSDAECKGQRICESGTCKAPSAQAPSIASD